MAGLLSRIADAFSPSAPATPAVRRFGDGVYNPLSGLGTSIDANAFNRHFVRPLTHYEIDQSYRGSWLMRKLIDKPAKEMTRTRRAWQADKPTIAKLEAEEKRLKVWASIKEAEIMRGLGGGAIFMWIEGDDPATPLDPARVKLAGIRNLVVRHRSRITLGEIIFDMADDWYGHPQFYQLNEYKLVRGSFSSELKFHPSRVIPFKGEEVPNLGAASSDQQFWGASKVEIALNAVLNSDAAQNSFASMVKDAVNVIIGVPNLTQTFTTTAEIEAYQTARMTAVNAARSIWRAIIKDNGKGGPNAEGAETVEYRQMNWAGIPDTLMVFIYPVAAAGNMPATVLLGKSPDGMNSTGNGDLTIWRDEIDGRRDGELRPCLDILDRALVPSALGKADAGVWWTFPALVTPSAKEQAETGKLKAETVQIYVNTGLLPTEALEKGVQNMLVEDGLMPGFDDALSELPEDERYPSLGEPEDPDPTALPDPNAQVDPQQPMRRAANDARFTDAEPKTLYVSRKLVNAPEFIAWAKGQGFKSTTPAEELHVTIAFSRTAIDWMKVGQDWSSDKDGKLTIPAGGPRIVQRLGDKGAVVLLFQSNDLKWRHEAIKEAGASFDFDEYQPHVTITYEAAPDFDLAAVKPYTGPLVFGPELFAQVVEDWEKGVTEE